VILVKFSEPVEAASAATAANYGLDHGIAVQSAALSPDGKTVTLTTSILAPGDYTLTVNNVRDKATVRNTILPNTQRSLNIPVSVVLVDFGDSAKHNTFGLAGWNLPVKDNYNNNVTVGPGGIDNADRQYSYEGVVGTPRPFAAPEKIVTTWYNGGAAAISFTPNISFTDPDRIVSGPASAWTKMTAVTIPVGGTATTQYAFTSSTAGTYFVVNINPDCNERNTICDKIELFSTSNGTSVSTALPATAGELDIRFFPKGQGLEIVFSKRLNHADLRIFDVSGKLAWRLSKFSAGKVDWNAADAGSGIYFLKVGSEGKQYFKKLLVQR